MAEKNQFDPQLKDHAFPGATITQRRTPHADTYRSAPPSISSFEEQRVSARAIGEMQERLTGLTKRCLQIVESATEDAREELFKSMLYEGNSLLQRARGVLVHGHIADTNQLLNETQEVIHRIELSL